MIYRSLPRICSFLAGSLLLCLCCSVQLLLFHLPLVPRFYVVPLAAGGLGGLLLGDRIVRNRTLQHALQQTNRRLEEALGEGDQRYQLLFQQNTAVQLLIDPHSGAIVETNAAAQQFYGYSAQELCGMTVMELNTAAPETTWANLQRALAKEQLSFHVQHRLKSGEVRSVAVYTVPLPVRGEIRLHAVVIDVSGHAQAETHLRRKTLEQRLLLDAIPVSVWYLKDAETFGSVNRAFAECMHRAPHEVAHQRLDVILNAEMLALALASNRQVYAQKQPLHYEQWLKLGTGDARYMVITKTPRLAEDGSVDFVVCSATDITKVHQARELLRIERDLHVALSATHSLHDTLRLCLDKAIEVSHTDCGGLYRVDHRDNSLHLRVHQGLSDWCVQLVASYPADSLHAKLVYRNKPIYTCFADLSHRIDTEYLQAEGLKAMAIVPIAFQGKVIACLNVASHSNERIPASGRIALERIVAHLGTFLVHKEQEMVIRQHQQNLDTLFKTLRDFVFILDREGTILDLNPAASERLGYQPEELIGRNVVIVHPEDRREETLSTMADMMADRRTYCRIPLLGKQGELIPVETQVTLGQWSGQQVIFGLSRDISSRLQLERQQQLLIKNEGLERMAGAMAHHFNNLMTIVTGNLQLAQEDLPPGSEAARLLTNALTGSQRAIELGQSLLIYTGQFTEATVPLDLSAVCRDHAAESAQRLPAHIRLRTDLALPGPVVTANLGQMTQVLNALITNAVEIIGADPGQITLRVTSVAASAIDRYHLFPAGWIPGHLRYGSLEVIDTGAGIDEQQMASIFDPFYSEKFVGRGLGLPLALSIIKKLDGAIAVTSTPHQGSTFQVLLPQEESAGTSAAG
jgi:PAS domain S-box-containing protein